jgi:ribosome-binding protein aMBF1 (putative translation factor)
MSECYRCGVSGEKVKLYGAISERGIVPICADCNAIEKLPLIKKPSETQIEDSKRQKSVRDMLTGMNRGKLLAGKEVSLRELVDRNLKERKEKLPSDLVENFNWTIQRIRRNRKITREQFSKGIGESEATVRMIEQGVLPNNDYKIISKIESYLGVSLRKPGSSGFPNTSITAIEEQSRKFNSRMASASESSKRLGFDRNSAENLKIADLRDMKKKQEDTKKPIDSWEEHRDENGEEILDEEDEDFFDEEDI